MMKVINIFLWVFGISVVTLIGAGVVVTNLIDPNEYKSNIEKVVEDRIGRKLTINGDLSISFFPWLGVDINDATLAQRDGFGNDAMVSFNAAHIRLKLLPVLKKQFEIDTILLKEPNINMVVLADGATNWGDIVERLSSTNSDINHSSPESSGALGLAGLVIEGISIEGGKLVFDDQSVSRKIVLSDVDLTTDRLVPGEPLDVQLSLNLEDNDLPIPMSLGFVTTVEFSLDLSQATLNQARIDLVGSGLGYTVLVPEASIDRNQQIIAAKEISISNGESKLLFRDLQVANFLSNRDISVQGGLTISAKDPLELLPQWGLNVDTGDYDIGKTTLDAGFSYVSDKLVINSLESAAKIDTHQVDLLIPYLHYDMADQSLEAPSVTLAQNDSKIAITKAKIEGLDGGLPGMSASARLALSGKKIPALLRQHHIDVLPDGIGQVVEFNAQFLLNENQLQVSELDAQIDDVRLSADVGVQSLSSPPYEYRFAVKTTALNIDQFLGLFDEGSDVASAEPAEVALLPIAALQGLNAKGTFSIASIIASGLKLDQLDMEVFSEDDVLTLPNVSAELYGGRLRGNFRYDVSGGIPDVGLVLDAANVDVGALLIATNLNQRLSGNAHLKSALKGRGRNVDELIASLGGELNTQLLNGAVRGIDIQASLLKAKKALGIANVGSTNQNLPQSETRFAELSGSFQVDGGVFRTNDLSMKAPAFRIQGGGDISLPTEQIDLSLDVVVVDSLEGQGGEELSQLKGITIPLLVDGPIVDPGYRLDMVTLARREMKKELEKVLKGEKNSESNYDGASSNAEQVLDQLSEDPAGKVEDILKQELKDKLKNKLLQSLGG